MRTQIQTKADMVEIFIFRWSYMRGGSMAQAILIFGISSNCIVFPSSPSAPFIYHCNVQQRTNGIRSPAVFPSFVEWCHYHWDFPLKTPTPNAWILIVARNGRRTVTQYPYIHFLQWLLESIVTNCHAAHPFISLCDTAFANTLSLIAPTDRPSDRSIDRWTDAS